MKRIGFLLIFAGIALFAFMYSFFEYQAVRAQTNQPLVLVITADGPVGPAMQAYIERGIKTAQQAQADLIVLQLDTPGGQIETMKNIITDIRASTVPVIVYVTPRGAMAASAGTLITLAGHASAMAPQTIIGAASPVDSSGGDLDPTLKAKQTEALKAIVRSLAEQRGAPAIALAQDMIDNARAVSAEEALKVRLVDFIAADLDDLLRQLDGFTVAMPDGPRALRTANAATETIGMSLIEQLLLILTDSNIVFILLSLGILALQIELSNPGAWMPGFIGVVSLALAFYGMGILNVNWFGLVFLVTAFVLFILDIKAPTHGALTSAGVASFIVGALVLFNSPGAPQFQRVSVPLVVGIGIAIGLMFAVILTFALRAQRNPIQFGAETLIGKTGFAKSDFGLSGQVQVESELWTAEPASESGKIRKGDKVEVVEVKGLRLKVKKL